MHITRITLCHVLFNPSSSSCSYSLLHLSSLGPRLRLHLPSSGPRLRFLLSSPGSKCIFRSRTPAPTAQNPRSFLHLLRIFVFFRELNIHHSNSISIYNKTIYIIKHNNNVLTLLSMQPSGYVPSQTAVLQFICNGAVERRTGQ